jgi:phospholipase C
VTLASWVCKGYYWVSNWVCHGFTYITEYVCLGFTYVTEIICKTVSLVARAVCVTWGWPIRFICQLVNDIHCGIVDLWERIFGGGKDFDPRYKHIFVLILENRSYDHMLGFAGLSGPDAESGASTAADGADPSVHVNSDRSATPPVDVAVTTPAEFKLSGDIHHEDPGHEFDHTLKQISGIDANYQSGNPYPPRTMSGFVNVHNEVRGSTDPHSVMNCYLSQRQLPVLTSLATEFAVCDRWFSSMPGPTWPNRFFAMAASSGGLDDSPGGLEIVISTVFDGYKFENGNLFDLLDKNCIEWEIFEGDEFPVAFALSGMNYNAMKGRFTDMSEFSETVSDPDLEPHFVFIEPDYGNILPGTAEDFTCGTSQHPLDDVTRGERLIKDVYESIRNSPHWENSLLIVTWDEHGGFYDHVPTPDAVPPGDSTSDPDNNQHGFDFSVLGVRVPAVVISPYIPRGTIDHRVYDHGSIPATVERAFGMSSLTQRDQTANDVLDLLSLDAPRTDAPEALPEPAESGWSCEGDEEPFTMLEAELTARGSFFRDEILESYLRRGRQLQGTNAPREDFDADNVVLPPSIRQALLLGARRYLSTYPRWDAKRLLRLEAGLSIVRDELDARLILHEMRARVHMQRKQDRTARVGYSRLKERG